VTGGFAESFVIRDGKAVGRILTPANPSPEVKFAAEELAAHLKLVSGATLDIAPDSGGALTEGSIRLVVATDAQCRVGRFHQPHPRGPKRTV
jgi:hypothetical protein